MTIQKAIRNGKIEFLRFIFSFIIVIHHTRYLVGDDQCMFLGGSLAVEFFFIVSGYLMMASIEKKRGQYADSTQLAYETQNFLIKKIRALCPELIIAYVYAFIFVCYAKALSAKEIARLFIDTIFEFFLIKMSGLYATSLNGVLWYVSSMLLCMAILYPLIRKFPDMMKQVVSPLISLLLFGYLCGNFGTPRTPLQWIGFTYKGNVRAMAAICLGVYCYHIVSVIKEFRFTIIGKIFLTMIETSCYTAVILYMYFAKASARDYFFIFLLAVGICISFSHISVGAKLFDNRICAFLGKFSLPMYLCHTYYSSNLKRLFLVEYSDSQKVLIYMICVFITSTAVYIVSRLLANKHIKIKNIIKKYLLSKN